MKKSICEKIFAAVLAVTLPAEFIAVMGMESDAGAWAWLLCVGCAVLQLTAMVMVKWTFACGKVRRVSRRSAKLAWAQKREEFSTKN